MIERGCVMISLLQKIPGKVLLVIWWIAVVCGFVTLFMLAIPGYEEGNQLKILPTILFGLLGTIAGLGRMHLENPFSWNDSKKI